MSEKKAYEHRKEVVGTADEQSLPPSKEHKETAYGDEETRNEITPNERGRTDGYGPRTHRDTKIDRADEAKDA